jgi:hypothetical protein
LLPETAGSGFPCPLPRRDENRAGGRTDAYKCGLIIRLYLPHRTLLVYEKRVKPQGGRAEVRKRMNPRARTARTIPMVAERSPPAEVVPG